MDNVLLGIKHRLVATQRQGKNRKLKRGDNKMLFLGYPITAFCIVTKMSV